MPISAIEKWTSVPTWVSDKYPRDYKPIQDVIDRRFQNKNTIRNGYAQELVESWEGLSDKELKRVGDILWRGDQLKQELGEKGLKKLNAREKQAYRTVREVLNFIWFEDRPALMRDLRK